MIKLPKTGDGVPGDHPISEPGDDSLGRLDSAKRFANHIFELDASRGLVVSVLGPWGSGKTSFVNLARVELQRLGLQAIDFNPWMFSGAEQLVDAFFGEISEELKVRPGLAEIGKSLEEYGELFSGLGSIPFAGPWIEGGRGIVKLLGSSFKRWKGGTQSRRKKVENSLAKLSSPLVVVLDDIDRLTTSEIRHVFRLVRLTASFPNVIYLLAFDRLRVERALSEDGIPGRDYLEKILQLALDLPAVPKEVLDQQIFKALERALNGVENAGTVDQNSWPDLFVEVVRPLIETMRDVRRYALAVRGTVTGLEGQIALADVLALEAIRLFLPDTFSRLHDALTALTTGAGSYGSDRYEDPKLKEEIKSLIADAGDHEEVVRAMVVRLFPAAQRHIGNTHFSADWKSRWLRERRVAHEDLLTLYLERVAGEGFRSFLASEKALSQMSDRNAFDEFLRALDPQDLERVIGCFEIYQDQFKPEQVEPGVVVLLNLLYEIPERPRGMFELESRFTVTRITYRLLRSLKEPSLVESAVRSILPQLHHLSAKLEVILQVGYSEHSGHELVSAESAQAIEREWRDQVRTASVATLLREPTLLKVLIEAVRGSESTESQIMIPNDPRLTLKLLRSALGYSTSLAVGSRSVRRSSRLSWDGLVLVFRDEQTLNDRIDFLQSTDLEMDEELSLLVSRYREGWRPE